MAYRRFFDYNPYGYYYAAPYNYDSYYEQQPAATRRSTRGIFAGAEPAAAKPAPRARKTRETKTSFSIPVHGPDSDNEPEPELKQKAPGARAKPVAPAMSAKEAVVRMQAAARGFLARKSVRAVREVAHEAEQVRKKMASEAEALVTDPRARVAVGEALMRMLLRLDAVRGARDYRRRVTKRVLVLQDAVDALETKSAPSSAPVEDATEVDAPEATAVETVEESAAAPELADAVERGGEMESIKTAVDTPTQVEVDEAVAASDPEAKAGEGEEKEVVPGDANVDVDEPEDSDAEGEWEMVMEDNALVAGTPDDQEPPRKEPACPLETMGTASAGAASDGVDARKVMEMVVALCEKSAQQCAVIGALAERVDALECTVRRMEDAESRRRRPKKLST
ncbi:cilia- and flagella-associated protein 91-like [Miscanthus floridulus]|uniref:cilia- and flagella-associated protein 91-like n=1 Tax=Miscanthus floridulus TaxID=154761 RepID=UPI0034581AFA